MNDTLSPLVSIIICVYNGEKYLERCLQSAMSQSYKNIEIIVVNDGSMDNTPVIIENYVKLDCRIIVINKQNGGISEARRIGVNRARGKYIQYLDCDDVLMSNAIGCLVNRAEETQADVVVAPFFFCEDGGRKESDSMEFEQMSGIEYLKCILCSRAYWAMCTYVSGISGKAPKRLLSEWSRARRPLEENAFSIEKRGEGYTLEYIMLTRDFYLKM